MTEKKLTEDKPNRSSVRKPDDAETPAAPAKEIGGRDGLDPTRFGDWEKNGRCIDF